MNFRARITLSFGVLAIAPLLVFGYGVEREMTARLDAEASGRVAALSGELRTDLATRVREDRARLHALTSELGADNQFRLASSDVGSAASERRWLLDWAAGAMRSGGFAMLQLQDSAGRILSSGQFRNDFDRLDPALPAAIGAAHDGAALIAVRTPDGSVSALATVDSFTVGGRQFTIVGGRGLDSAGAASMAREGDIHVVLAIADSVSAVDTAAAISIPYFEDRSGRAPTVARLLVVQDPGPMKALRRGVIRWLFITLGGTLLIAMLIAAWLGTRVSRPIADLANKTSKLDLDRLDQDFSTDRNDEIGSLSRLLAAMATRLKSGAARLRETERLAATGDLARQVNHDIKNGLAPIRNVVRHLTQVAEREPDRLAAIYLERQKTLESSVEYLDNLARNYAKLSPSLDHATSVPVDVVREVTQAVVANGARIETHVADSLPAVRSDAVVLRRILDNLMSNAVEALEGRAGRVTISAELSDRGPERRVRFTIEDTGRGMRREELDRAFDDFYTTKATGTGLGLSVVRRLLTDLGGSIKVETEPGAGSTFIVEIPAA
jgi:signal transduction histidine kinase